jgi:hypothetical protein
MDRSENYRTIYHSDKKEIVELFVGKSVKKISDDQLELSDGTVLQIVPNVGGCICGAGDYDIDYINECENIITNVELVVSESDYGWDSQTVYDIFVYSGHQKINLVSIKGDDGNGYYGTGFWINVKADADA